MGDATPPVLMAADFWAEVAPCEHLLQIYTDENVLMDSLEGFVAGGILAGDAVIVIATAQHREELAKRLRMCGLDPDAAQADGTYLPLDAEQTLAQFMVGGWPNDDLFNRLIAQLLHPAREQGRRVRAFGEMVALMWANGQKGATVRLEYLWHQLCEEEGFSLLCAYPKKGFHRDALSSLHDIFAAHSKVIPG